MPAMKCAHKDCDRDVDWDYMPGNHGYCDDHVPRGCACNAERAPRTEFLDAKGRRLPCVEYNAVGEAIEDAAIERLKLKTDPDSILLAKVIADYDHVVGYWIRQTRRLESALWEEDEDDFDDGDDEDAEDNEASDDELLN